MQIDPILIVDDEIEMRIAMAETLKHCGYPVELSHNAFDAIKKFKNNSYSLVISDMTIHTDKQKQTDYSTHLRCQSNNPRLMHYL